MQLSAFTAGKRLAIFEDLQAGREPREGTFDAAVLKEGKAKGAPQMGSTRYEPDAIWLEFIYPDPQSSASVLVVQLTPPERIVFLPVPGWVVEQIWQGEIAGSYAFESEAQAKLEEFQAQLQPEANRAHFGPQMAKRRE